MDTENEDVAVAACYVQAGDKFTINSIVHGDYYLIVQAGEDYIPALGLFSKNNKTLVYNAKVEANVVSGRGFLTVGIVKITQEDIDTCDFDLGYSPELGE